MLFQKPFVCKASWAALTRVRSFFSMSFYMPMKAAVIGTTEGAQRARIRLFSGVNMHVVFKMDVLNKLCWAYMTLKGPFACMNS